MSYCPGPDGCIQPSPAPCSLQLAACYALEHRTNATFLSDGMDDNAFGFIGQLKTVVQLRGSSQGVLKLPEKCHNVPVFPFDFSLITFSYKFAEAAYGCLLVIRHVHVIKGAVQKKLWHLAANLPDCIYCDVPHLPSSGRTYCTAVAKNYLLQSRCLVSTFQATIETFSYPAPQTM